MVKKTVKYTKKGAAKLPTDKPVVYKIMTASGATNYVGVANRGGAEERIKEHLDNDIIPGTTVEIEQVETIDDARQKENRIIVRIKPKYNIQAKDDNTLYSLNPMEFERLCVEILKEQGYEHVELVGGPGDQGVDIIGEIKGQKIAVQVKHTKIINGSMIRNIINKVKASSYQPKQIIIMTSATISHSLKALITEWSSDIIVKLIDREELLQALIKAPNLEQSQLASAQRRTNRQRWELTYGSLMAIISIATLLSSSRFFFF